MIPIPPNLRDSDFCSWLPAVVDLARVAGEEILSIYNSDSAIHPKKVDLNDLPTERDKTKRRVITRKEDYTPLTEADIIAHHTIVEGLTRLTPHLPVLSEESKAIPFEERARWRRYWLVDPLDGTREFISRNGQFTVNIALIEGHDAIMGVILAPTTGVCYYACRGEGAFRQISPTAVPEQIHSRPFRGDCLVVAGAWSHGTKDLQRLLDNLPTCEVVNVGSALKSCMVAEGKVDLYPRLGPTSEWDTAAAQCVVEEAGGRVTNVRMERLRYNTKRSLLNPHFFVSGDPSRDWSRFLF
ncbi:3'(2'),5'-bisphosphate nucleotidase CysQ [Gammaproteobacteria bacterium]